MSTADHTALVDLIDEYLEDANKSARWLGLTVAQNARLVPNLRRGQHYPARIMLALSERLRAFYEAEYVADLILPATSPAFVPNVAPVQRLAA
jgi:hypothetical protein